VIYWLRSRARRPIIQPRSRHSTASTNSENRWHYDQLASNDRLASVGLDKKLQEAAMIGVHFFRVTERAEQMVTESSDSLFVPKHGILIGLRWHQW
jgi:hypothetical protein